MHVLFVHTNFPGQFRCIAPRLASEYGWTCTFATERAGVTMPGIQKVVSRPLGGATRSSPVPARPFDTAIGHAHGFYEALKARPDIKPDLVVAHSGFGSSLFLPYLYDAPVINFFEYYYRPVGQDLGYRPEVPVTERMLLRSRARNAMTLLDLDNCDRGWCPSEYQRRLFPPEFRDKIEVLPEGIDTQLYRRDPTTRLTLPDGSSLPPGTRVVTYVSRGLELMRGFDVFMRAAKLILQRFPDVVFIIVGDDRAYYGNDERFVRERTLTQHVLKSDHYDPSRFCFTGRVPEATLAQILSVSDLHVYLTVPFVPSWSLLDAMACECVVLASDQACVRQYVTHESNGLLCDFFDVDGIAEHAVRVLRQPVEFRRLGAAARATIEARYSVDVCLPRIKALFEGVASRTREPTTLAQKLIRPGTLTRIEPQRDVAARERGGERPGLTPHLLGSLGASSHTGSRKPSTVLFCWELGRALGHMVPMLPLAEGLVRRGHRVVVALRNCSGGASVFARSGVSFMQAPFKSEGPTYYRRTESFPHIMANVGWGSVPELFGLGCAWRNLMGHVKPDVMLFDYSPTALLAARCFPQVKTLVTGLGFFCPPDLFPLPALVEGELDVEKLKADELRVLERGNAVLEQWKRPPMERLGRLHGEAHETLLETFEELDHYADRPAGARYWGPIHSPGGESPRWPAGGGKKVYAYLKNSRNSAEILAALADLGGPTVVFSDGVDPAVRKRFDVPTMRFETRRLDMARVREECDLAVLNANHGTMCQLLLGGKPMLQVPLQLEQQILARRVEALGAAETVWNRGEGAGEEIRRKLALVATQPRYSEAARGFARRYSTFDPAAQVERMVARVEELMEQRGTGADKGRGRQGDKETGGQGERRAKVFAG